MCIDKLTIPTNTKNTKKLMAAEIYSIPESNGGATIPYSIPVGFNGYGFNGNNGGFGLGGWGGGILGFLLGAMINNNGNGLFGGGGNNHTSDLVMQAVTSQGEASRTAIQSLSTMLGQDFNTVSGNLQVITSSLNQIANAQGMNAMQVINAIQSGNAALASQLCQCCCENRTAILEQTNTIQQGINGVQQSIAAKAAADQMATYQQTVALQGTMNNNYIALDNKIDAMESARKDREITALTAKLAQVESQQFTVGAIQQAVAPVLGQLAGIQAEVEAIKRCQPATITLPNNSMTAVPTIWANGVADYVVDKIASSLNGGTTTPTTPATAINK